MEYVIKGKVENILKITPLGAGSEVGRSCIMLEYKRKKIMFDCGIHPAYNGRAALPYFDYVELSDIDLILITHFHLDHCGALPFLTEKTNYSGEVYTTHPTKAIYAAILSDYLKKNNQGENDMLYSEVDISSSLKKLQLIDYHQELEHNGIKFPAYNAGHVIGAAMFLIEIEGVKILYTGDYSREEDRHLNPAEFPACDVQIFIVESTYGTQPHEDRKIRESRFTKAVSEVVERGGKCLLPVFALGRAQEILLILEEYWSTHPNLQKVPIYYASALAKKCMKVFDTHFNLMSAPFKKQLEAGSNPFMHLKYITTLDKQDEFPIETPAVVMASPGMLQKGFSRTLFEKWCISETNGIVFTGYAVEGTLAQQIINGKNKFVASDTKQDVLIKMTHEYISFSAHCDFKQTIDFVKHINPYHVVLVHGDSTKMGELKRELEKNFAPAVKVSSPKNCEEIAFICKTDLIAKVIGDLATTLQTSLMTHPYPELGDAMKEVDEDKKEEAEYERKNYIKVSGVITKKGGDIRIMSQTDVPKHTHLKPCTISQKIYIPYHHSIDTIKIHLETLFSSVVVRADNKIEIQQQVLLWYDETVKAIAIEWESSRKMDRTVDSIGWLIMELEEQQYKGYFSEEGLLKRMNIANGTSKHSTMKQIIKDRYQNVVINDELNTITIVSGDEKAIIDCNTMTVTCPTEPLKQTLINIVEQIQKSLSPMLIQ